MNGPAVTPSEGSFSLQDFRFASGETLPELRIHYRTLGRPARDASGIVRNAVLLLHGTTANGSHFLAPTFAGALFGVGQPLDARKFFIVIPDGIGHGRSSKPSDGLHGRFPGYGYRDMVNAQHQLLTRGLGIDHLRLVIGTSMGGMHTWLWGQDHPGFMDALLPLASLPAQVSARNRAWRRVIIDAIRNDPAWSGGEYSAQPPALRTAAQVMWLMGENAVLRQNAAPTLAQTDLVMDAFVADYLRTFDANDVIYALAASYDYDPEPGLEKIHAPLWAVNFADDLINPPELGILEKGISRLARGRAVTLPPGVGTRGHGSFMIAALWRSYLVDLLQASAPPAGRR